MTKRSGKTKKVSDIFQDAEYKKKLEAYECNRAQYAERDRIAEEERKKEALKQEKEERKKEALKREAKKEIKEDPSLPKETTEKQSVEERGRDVPKQEKGSPVEGGRARLTFMGEYQYIQFLKAYTETNSLDLEELLKKSDYFKKPLLRIFENAHKETFNIHRQYEDKKRLPTKEELKILKEIYPDVDEKIFMLPMIRDPETLEALAEISVSAMNEATLELNKILADISEAGLKPYSVNLWHPFTGRPRDIKIQQQLKRITHEIYESGELVIESDNEDFPQRLKPFIHKLIDYCIVTMDINGDVSSLTDGSVFKHFKLGHGKNQRDKLKKAIEHLTKTKLRTEMIYKIKGTTKDELTDTGKEDVISARYPDEPILKPHIVTYETMSGATAEKVSHYKMSSGITDLKRIRGGVIYRDMEYFSLPDDEFEMMVSIHGKLRQPPHYEKGEYVINFKDFTEHDTSVHKLTSQSKRVIITLHKKFDHLVKCGVIEKYYITKRGNKTVLTKTWYQNSKYKLQKRQGDNILPNDLLFKDMMYHFVATEKFKDEHKNIEYKRREMSKQKSIPLPL